MRIVTLPIVLLAVLASGRQPIRQAQGGPAPAAPPLGAEALVKAAVPVVVELFTSEGCSSCPPADSLLSKLAREQPVPGVQVIPLGMHVTYWDRLGWKDPAALNLATARQQSYGRVFGEDKVYTPQAVIDGQDELVGSDEAGVTRAVAKAAERSHARLEVAPVLDGATLHVEVTIAELPAGVGELLDVRLVLTEDGLTSAVKHGENSGRTLHHDAAVRAVLGTVLTAGRPITFHTTLRPEWRREQMRVVALLQGRKTQRIWGAASIALK